MVSAADPAAAASPKMLLQAGRSSSPACSPLALKMQASSSGDGSGVFGTNPSGLAAAAKRALNSSLATLPVWSKSPTPIKELKGPISASATAQRSLSLDSSGTAPDSGNANEASQETKLLKELDSLAQELAWDLEEFQNSSTPATTPIPRPVISTSPPSFRPFKRKGTPTSGQPSPPTSTSSADSFTASQPHRISPTTAVPDLAPSPAPTEGIPKKRKTNPQKYALKACAHCKTSHVACDSGRPCQRCIRIGKASTCVDAEQKKRGRPCSTKKAMPLVPGPFQRLPNLVGAASHPHPTPAFPHSTAATKTVLTAAAAKAVPKRSSETSARTSGISGSKRLSLGPAALRTSSSAVLKELGSCCENFAPSSGAVVCNSLDDGSLSTLLDLNDVLGPDVYATGEACGVHGAAAAVPSTVPFEDFFHAATNSPQTTSLGSTLALLSECTDSSELGNTKFEDGFNHFGAAAQTPSASSDCPTPIMSPGSPKCSCLPLPDDNGETADLQLSNADILRAVQAAFKTFISSSSTPTHSSSGLFDADQSNIPNDGTHSNNLHGSNETFEAISLLPFLSNSPDALDSGQTPGNSNVGDDPNGLYLDPQAVEAALLAMTEATTEFAVADDHSSAEQLDMGTLPDSAAADKDDPMAVMVGLGVPIDTNPLAVAAAAASAVDDFCLQLVESFHQDALPQSDAIPPSLGSLAGMAAGDNDENTQPPPQPPLTPPPPQQPQQQQPRATSASSPHAGATAAAAATEASMGEAACEPQAVASQLMDDGYFERFLAMVEAGGLPLALEGAEDEVVEEEEEVIAEAVVAVVGGGDGSTAAFGGGHGAAVGGAAEGEEGVPPDGLAATAEGLGFAEMHDDELMELLGMEYCADR